jgi:hypothetical protein
MIKIINILLLSLLISSSLSAQWKKQGTIKGASNGYFNIREYSIKGNDVFLDSKANKAYKNDGTFWKNYSLVKNAECLNNAELLRIIPNGLGTTSDFSIVGACNTFNGDIQYVTDEKGNTIKKFGPVSAYTDNGKTYFINASKNYFVDTLRDFEVYKMGSNGFTLDKVFTNIRTFNITGTDNIIDEKYFYTISKEYKMTIYDRTWAVIGTIQLPQFPSNTQATFAYEISQKKYNDDANWEVEIFFISKTYEYTSVLYDSNSKVLLKTKNFIIRDKNYAITTADSFVIYKAKNLLKLKSYIQNKPSYGYTDNVASSLFLYETNNADSTIKITNPDGTALQTLSFKGNPFLKTTLFDVSVIGQGNNTFALLKEFKHNADKFKSYEIVYPNGTSLKLDGNYAGYSKFYNDTQARYYFEKDNGDGTSDYEIYNYGTYSPAKEIAVLEGVKVFPNPFNDAINIQLPKDIEGKSTIIISNMLGETFGKFESSDSFVTIEEAANFPVGFYLISIENNGKRTVQKLIKN